MLNLSIFRYASETKGAIAILFALMLPILVSFVGLCIDFSLAQLEKQRLQNALDNAALMAGTSGETDNATLERMIIDFINANYKKGVNANNIDFSVNNGIISITARGAVRTSFLSKVIGGDEIEISSNTNVYTPVKRIEVVVALNPMKFGRHLDFTDVVNELGENLIVRMEDLDRDNPDIDVLMGMVPINNYIVLNPYCYGEDTEGNYYDEPFCYKIHPDFLLPYDELIKTKYYQNWTEWNLEYYLPNKLEGLTPEDKRERCAWQQQMTLWCYSEDDFEFNKARGYIVTDTYYYNPSSSYWSNVEFQFEDEIHNPFIGHYSNLAKRSQGVMPLTSDWRALKDYALEFSDTASYTHYISTGIMWAFRLISPAFPFREGGSFEDHSIKKYIILVTATAHWPNYGIDNIEDAKKACDILKEKEIEVYVVDIIGDLDERYQTDWLEVLQKYCASSSDHIYSPESESDLAKTFSDIAKRISQARIAN